MGITLKFDSGNYKCACGSTSMVFTTNLKGKVRYHCFACEKEVTDEAEKRILNDVLFSPVEYKSAWAEFVTGKWQKKMPTVPGVYPTASQDGGRGKDRTLVILPDKEIGDISSFVQWSGWWWSKPYPELPPPPYWDDEE